MDEKLEILLKRINLNTDYYSFFENAVLDKIIISKKSKHWLVKITIDNYLPVEVMDYLNNNSNLLAEDVTFSFDVKNKDYNKLL